MNAARITDQQRKVINFVNDVNLRIAMAFHVGDLVRIELLDLRHAYGSINSFELDDDGFICAIVQPVAPKNMSRQMLVRLDVATVDGRTNGLPLAHSMRA